MNEPCPFCAIAAGDAPATFRYRARRLGVMVIEPLNPVVPGHVLVVPDEHVANATENPQVAAKVMELAAQWVNWAREFGGNGFTYDSVNIITSVGADATQTVMHLHLHIVPRREGDGLALPWSAQ